MKKQDLFRFRQKIRNIHLRENYLIFVKEFSLLLEVDKNF